MARYTDLEVNSMSVMTMDEDDPGRIVYNEKTCDLKTLVKNI